MLLADVTLAQYVMVAAAAFFTSVLGGVAGYGTGLLLLPVLIPIVGPEAVVPILSLASLATNASRLMALRGKLEWRKAGLILLCALPTCIVGAYGYTRLSGPTITLLLGFLLILLVPLRRVLVRARGHLRDRGLAAAGVGYGLLVGGTSGAGVVLISILLAAGLEGMAVIATDAAISLALGVVKAAVFQSTGALPLGSWIMALVLATVALPGAYTAKWLMERMPVKMHALILDGAVVVGGVLLIIQGADAVW